MGDRGWEPSSRPYLRRLFTWHACANGKEELSFLRRIHCHLLPSATRCPLVRVLVENAGSMQPVDPEGNREGAKLPLGSQNISNSLCTRSICLKTPPIESLLWNTSDFLHTAPVVAITFNSTPDGVHSAIVKGKNPPGTTSTHTRSHGSRSGAAVMDWISTQALLCQYTFFGSKSSFSSSCAVTSDDKVPNLPWSRFLPTNLVKQ